MNDSGIYDADWNIERKMKTFLIRLKIIDDDMVLTAKALSNALSAAHARSFGSPDRLIIDPNMLKALQNITFNDDNLKP